MHCERVLIRSTAQEELCNQRSEEIYKTTVNHLFLRVTKFLITVINSRIFRLQRPITDDTKFWICKFETCHVAWSHTNIIKIIIKSFAETNAPVDHEPQSEIKIY